MMDGDQLELRDQGLAQWIENKLGSNELWGGRQAASMLNLEILTELETCFQELEPHIKLKIIQAMAHFSPKTLKTWKEPLLNLLEVARRDPDDWVETVADAYHRLPDLGLIQCSTKSDSYFNRTLEELLKIVENREGGEANIPYTVPPDCEFVCSRSLETMFPFLKQINTISHFTPRKQKTKYDKLLEDVIKASEQQSDPANKKNHGLISSFPIKIRSSAKKLNDFPMKGIQSANAFKMSGGFTNESKKYQQRTLYKRDGGARLIEFTELPMNSKRKRNLESITVVNKNLSKKKPSLTIEGKEDYKDKTNEGLIRETSIEKQTNIVLEKAECIGQQGGKFEQFSAISRYSHSLPQIQQPQAGCEGTSSDLKRWTADTDTNQLPNSCMEVNSSKDFPSSSNSFAQYDGLNLEPQNESTNATTTNSNSLALQQFQCLLKDANKLTPVSYKLMISFLSGSKINPLQDKLGSLVTLPLSESIEFEQASGDNNKVTAFLVETFFQMDYRNGEWKRLKKSRMLKAEELSRYSRGPSGISFAGPFDPPLFGQEIGENNSGLQHLSNFDMRNLPKACDLRQYSSNYTF